MPDVAAFRCTHSGYGSHAQIVQCNSCGYVYSNPRWDEDELIDAYSAVEDEIYVHERAGRERTFAKHLKELEKWTGQASSRSLLDVGAYIGVFVEIAQAGGWQPMGIEPSRWAVTVAQSRNLPVIEGTLGSRELSDKRFDALTMWDVIEHVDDPAAELRRAYELLRPGGIIAVHTMDIDSLAARLLGQRWPWLMSMHIHYFSRKTLERMLQDNGYEVLWIGAQGRYLSLGYIASRMKAFNERLGIPLAWLIEKLGASETTIPVNFGDLITAFARKSA
jgi:SAM-dependent methyltransferase